MKNKNHLMKFDVTGSFVCVYLVGQTAAKRRIRFL